MITLANIPVLEADRLVLRAPRLSDFDDWAEYFASQRSVYEGGPFQREQAWSIWAADVACWLLRGYGAFGMDDKATGAFLGEVGIYHRDNYPGPELGWFVLPQSEGQGYAAEGATAVLNWVRETFDWDHITNIVDPSNARSIALGLRLGGVIDHDLPGVDPGDIVIRHDLRGAA